MTYLTIKDNSLFTIFASLNCFFVVVEAQTKETVRTLNRAKWFILKAFLCSSWFTLFLPDFSDLSFFSVWQRVLQYFHWIFGSLSSRDRWPNFVAVEVWADYFLILANIPIDTIHLMHALIVFREEISWNRNIRNICKIFQIFQLGSKNYEN